MDVSEERTEEESEDSSGMAKDTSFLSNSQEKPRELNWSSEGETPRKFKLQATFSP